MVFSIIQWNIKGYYNNFCDLQLIIREFDPNFISLQETHCPFNFIPRPPKNYTAYFSNSPHNSTAKQGIGVLVKSNIPHKLIHINTSYQVIAIEISLNFKFTILSFYIPPNKEIDSSELSTIFSSINGPVIVNGDFNCWNTLWGSMQNNKRGIDLETAFDNSNLCILNDGSPTHLSTHGTLTHTDITACNLPLLPSLSWSILDDLHNSDHFPIRICLRTLEDNSTPAKQHKYLFDRADWTNYSQRTEEILNRPFSKTSNRDAALFTKAIRSSANKFIPQSKNKTYTPRRVVPWWNDSLTVLRRQKMLSWQSFKSNPCLESLILYKKNNAKFRVELKKAKRESFERFTKSIDRNTPTSNIWRKINNITQRKQHNTIKAINTQNGTLTNPVLIANAFGTNWAEYASDTNFSHIFNSNKQLSNTILPSPTVDKTALLLEEPITMNELSYCLSKVKGSTPGIDRISYQMIKPLSSTSKLKLIDLYNTIFESGIIPHNWKLATIVPIPKNNSALTIDTYRPISLLPCLSKIMERIIAARLSWFMEKRKLIAKEQVAFKPNRGCDDALLHFDNYISKALSARNHITMLSIDFEKAFDRIGSHVILKVLSSWKIGQRVFNFIKSFLSNRYFKVKVNGFLSDKFALSNGIPQGSPLSVVLFQIAFNEVSKILNNTPHLDHCLYADDLYILCKKNDNSETTDILSYAMVRISEWANYSGAKISLRKSKKFHICRKLHCNSNNHNVQSNGIVIQNVNSLKILGMVFSHKYQWKEHCKMLKNSLMARANIIRYLSSRSSIHINTLAYLTKTLVLGKLDYGMYLYSNSPKATINILKSAYHKAARASVYAIRTTPINNILNEAGLPTIEHRILETKGKILLKILTSTNSIIDSDILTTISARRPKRIKSIIALALEITDDTDIPKSVTKKTTPKPPWKFKNSSIDLSLSKLKKTDTTKEQFISLWKEKTFTLKNNGFRFLYTDGSKSPHNLPAYAVVDEIGNDIAMYTMYDFTSIFTSEACAILFAIKHAIKSKNKTIIVSDSLSVLKAINNPFNNNWNTVIEIRNTLMNNEEKLRIHWVPSHTGIKGNDSADIAARFASYAPIMLDDTVEKIDLHSHITNHLRTKFRNSQTPHYYYHNINPDLEPPIYPTNITKTKLGPFPDYDWATQFFPMAISSKRIANPIVQDATTA